MKRPKLYYVPGMISLLVLPVLFYMYQPVEKKQNVLKFVLLEGDLQQPELGLIYYTRSYFMAGLKGKKINTVYYDENHDLNAKKLKFIAQEALKLKFYNDTTQVIKVRLTNETTYNEFVQLVNAMYKNEQKRYSLLDNDFYILGDWPPEPEEVRLPFFICGNSNLHEEYYKPYG